MMFSYGKNEKKIVFASVDKTHAELIIRLRYEGITQGEFFRNIIALYLKNDSRLLSITDGLREEKKKYGKTRNRKIQNSHHRRVQNEKLYGLSAAEKEEIFDLLETEVGDL